MKSKWLTALGLSLIIIVSMSFGAIGATKLKEVKALLNTTLKFKLKGETWTPKDTQGNFIYPLTYNGTTYLPVRVVGEATGLEVSFDAKSNTVFIGEKEVVDTNTIPANAYETTAEVIKKYLADNFSTLKTSIGDATFTYNLHSNNTIIFPYDYWIQVEYPSSFFYDVQYSNKLSTDTRTKVKQELKEFQEKLARAVIDKFPGTKFYGGYYDSWYRYPSIKVDLVTRKYYSWTNYDKPDLLANDEYNQTKASSFRWYPDLDDEL